MFHFNVLFRISNKKVETSFLSAAEFVEVAFWNDWFLSYFLPIGFIPIVFQEKEERYKVDEAKALVESIVRWKVVSEVSYPVHLDHLSKDFVLHRRNLANLNLVLSGRKDISVVFINISQITS